MCEHPAPAKKMIKAADRSLQVISFQDHVQMRVMVTQRVLFMQFYCNSMRMAGTLNWANNL